MNKVTFRQVVNATYRVDNSDDSERLYDISADANVVDSRLDNFQNGVAVRRDNQSAVCRFSENDSPYLNTSFSNMTDAEELSSALQAVSAFINDARASIPNLDVRNE